MRRLPCTARQSVSGAAAACEHQEPRARRREKNLEKTLKETRLKARKEANRREGEGAAGERCDEDLEQLEAAFYAATAAERGQQAGG